MVFCVIFQINFINFLFHIPNNSLQRSVDTFLVFLNVHALKCCLNSKTASAMNKFRLQFQRSIIRSFITKLPPTPLPKQKVICTIFEGNCNLILGIHIHESGFWQMNKNAFGSIVIQYQEHH